MHTPLKFLLSFIYIYTYIYSSSCYKINPCSVLFLPITDSWTPIADHRHRPAEDAGGVHRPRGQSMNVTRKPLPPSSNNVWKEKCRVLIFILVSYHRAEVRSTICIVYDIIYILLHSSIYLQQSSDWRKGGYIHIYVYFLRVCVCVCVRVCLWIYIYICMYVCVYVWHIMWLTLLGLTLSFV